MMARVIPSKDLTVFSTLLRPVPIHVPFSLPASPLCLCHPLPLRISFHAFLPPPLLTPRFLTSTPPPHLLARLPGLAEAGKPRAVVQKNRQPLYGPASQIATCSPIILKTRAQGDDRVGVDGTEQVHFRGARGHTCENEGKSQ